MFTLALPFASAKGVFAEHEEGLDSSRFPMSYPVRFPAISLLVVAFAVFSFSACAAKTEVLPESHLAPDPNDPELLRYVKGDGSIADVTLAAELSRKRDRFVIVVATTSDVEAPAIGHAKELKAWFIKNIDEVSEIPIIVYLNDKGVGYTYYISGMNYYHPEWAVGGIMTPEQTGLSLENVVHSYKARKIIRNEGSKFSEYFD